MYKILLVAGCFFIRRSSVAFVPPTTQSHSKLQQQTWHHQSSKFRRLQTPEKPKRLPLQHSTQTNSDHNDRANRFQRLTITGASVSSLGFLVFVNSSLGDDGEQLAFPIQLTSSGTPPTVSSNKDTGSNNNITIPSIFRENVDQTSVTTPEALTYLQLINGVDMATPILPPDTLSLLCVWYAFLLDDESNSESGIVEVEDELGLDCDKPADSNHHRDFSPSLEYIRSFVKTMLFDITGTKDENSNYLNITQWQRGKVRLPDVRLREVRVEEVETATAEQPIEAEVERIPLKFTLECSVDDDSKSFQLPLFNIPESFQSNDLRSREDVQVSEKVLQKLAHNFNNETSAAFIALSLYHRYQKSKGATLLVSHQLLHKLADLQEARRGQERYCWIAPDVSFLNTIIRASDIPFRALSDLQESDKRVLQYLEEKNFGNIPNSPLHPSEGEQNKKAMTVEQLATQQRLKSAYKVATLKNDTAALEKIQQAMEDFERQLQLNNNSNTDEEENESSLQKIQRAMEMNSSNNEDAVSLIDELENAMDENDNE